MWKANFEGNVGLRKDYGSSGATAFTDPNKPNEITIFIKGMNKANMMKARETNAYQDAMKNSGAVGEAQVRFLSYVTELDT